MSGGKIHHTYCKQFIRICMYVIIMLHFFPNSLNNRVIPNRSNATAIGMKTTAFAPAVSLNESQIKKGEVQEEVREVPILITSMGGSGTTFLANVFKSAGIEVLHEAVGRHGSVGWWQLFNLNQLRVWETLITLNMSYSVKSSVARVQKMCQNGGIWVRTNGGKYLKPCQKGGELNFNPYFPEFQRHPIKFKRVFHQIRDPLKTISSFSKYCGHSQLWKMACSITPDLLPYWNADRRKSSRYRNNYKSCTRFMMYHWLSWNALLSNHADWSYRIENTTALSICIRAFKDHPDILNMCNHPSISDYSEKFPVRRNSKQYVGRVNLKPSHLYDLDCKLAQKIFNLAVTYGYSEYESVSRACDQ